MTRTIEGVLAGLDRVVADALEDGDRAGYFALLYRKVTAKVKEGIAAGFSDDPGRMERLDVLFADRSLDAVAVQVLLGADAPSLEDVAATLERLPDHGPPGPSPSGPGA